jgi:hypothetical protein
MKTRTNLFFALAIFAGIFILFSCSKSNNSLAPFQPEITNIIDNFQLQATKVDNVTTVLNYNWNNTGVISNIDKSGAITSGEAKVTVYDAANKLVYNGDLKLTGSEQSISGTPGTWKIKVELTSLKGDLNFRVQKGG